MLGAALFLGVVTFVGWILSSYLIAVWRAHEAVSWPAVEATIVSSSAVRGCGKGSSYYPVVKYEYMVDGVQHVGTRIAFGNVGCDSESAADVIASEYPVGRRLPVAFNPELPSETVIVIGDVLSDTWLGIVLMAAMLLLTTILYVYQTRSNHRLHADA